LKLTVIHVFFHVYIPTFFYYESMVCNSLQSDKSEDYALVVTKFVKTEVENSIYWA